MEGTERVSGSALCRAIDSLPPVGEGVGRRGLRVRRCRKRGKAQRRQARTQHHTRAVAPTQAPAVKSIVEGNGDVVGWLSGEFIAIFFPASRDTLLSTVLLARVCYPCRYRRSGRLFLNSITRPSLSFCFPGAYS